MRFPPVLPATIAALIGILAERGGCVAAALTFVIAALLFVIQQRRFAIVIAAAAGIATSALYGHPIPLTEATHAVTIAGVATDARKTGIATSQTTFTLVPERGMAVRVAARGVIPSGSCVVVRAHLEPFDEARNPGEPSVRAIEAERGIGAIVRHAHSIRAAPCAPLDARAWFPRARAYASGIVHAVMPPIPAAIVAGALWGERGGLPPDVTQAFQDTGTVHVLVTAGLHLGVVAGVVGWCLMRLGANRATIGVATIAIVWLYAVASGAHLPSLRAAVMVTIGLVAYVAGRRAFSWNTYCAAMLAIALAWPAAVGGVSFALSFSCVGAILLFASPIAKACERARIPAFASEALALTFATQIGVWPLTAATFLAFAPYAPLANVVVVPATALTMILGFATLLTLPIPELSRACADVTTFVGTGIADVVVAIAALPHAHVALPPPHLAAIVAYDAVALGSAYALHRGRATIAIAALVCASLGIVAGALHRDKSLVVTMLDVGQGDAILVQTPRGHAFAIDTGGALERGRTEDGGSPAEAVGERIVVPAIVRLGVTHLDGIILSHPHGDHAGGLFPILRTIGADWIADSGQSYAGHAFVRGMTYAREHAIAIRTPQCGDSWHTDDGVTLRFLAPCQPYFRDGKNDVNENSIVVMLEYGTFRMLFMGDAGTQSEARLLAAGIDLHADVLKVGHHGSAYASSDAFLAAVRPKIALISVGRHNTFGHPAPRTLAALDAIGSALMQTGRCGAISVNTDPQSVSTAVACTNDARAISYKSRSGVGSRPKQRTKLNV